MKKYLYLILFFLVCVPAIAGTINSYTLKSPPDDADTIVIYDSDDGSTKKIEVGDISGSGAGINWSSYPDLTALTSAQEFLVNNAGTSSSINWEVVQTQFPWTDGGTNIYTTTTTDLVAIGTTTPNASLHILKNSTNDYMRINSTAQAGGNVFKIDNGGNIGIATISPTTKLQLVGSGEANSFNIDNFWNMFHSLVGFGGSSLLDYFWLHPSVADTSMRLALMGNGTIGGTPNSLIAGMKIFQTTNITDLTNSCDFGMYMTSSGMRFNTKSNGSCPTFPVNWGRQDTTIDMTLSAGNLGIGTITPIERLHVATGSGQTVLFESTSTGTGGGAALRLQQDSGAAVAANSRVGTIQAVGATDSSHTIGVGSSLDFIAKSSYSGSNLETDLRLRLVPNGSTTLAEVARFMSNGNVGIGTSAPVSMLEVNGLIIPDKVTADPCTAGQEGALFYNDTSNYWCGCNGTDDVKLTDNTTSCF